MAPSESTNPPRAGPPCPICRRPPVAEFRPFCSQRCQHVDLGRWLKGGYRIPTNETPAESEVPGAAPDAKQGGKA